MFKHQIPFFNHRLLGLLIALLVLVLSGCTGVQLAPSQSAARVPTAAPVLRSSSGLPAMRPAELPPEARETLALIVQGGPFPFSRDGIEFQNRERLLPRKPKGYYREYTVITPGSRDRGARRLVTGKDGEIYYTQDHYESFVQVVDQ